MRPRNIQSQVCRLLLLVVVSLALQLCAAQQKPLPPASLTNPYDAELLKIEQEFPAAATPVQSVLLDRAYGLREYLTDAAQLTTWMSVVASHSSSPLVCDKALLFLQHVDLATGNIEQAQRALQQLGFVRSWSLIGPFPAASAPSAEKTLSDLVPDSQRRMVASGPQLWLDLANFFPFNGQQIAYVATSLHSDITQIVALRFGADSPITLYVNGERVYSRASAIPAAFDQDYVAVQLNQGWNSVLLKLTRQSEGPWRFALRATGLAGGGIRLPASPDRPLVLPTPESAPKLPKPDDLVEQAKALVTGTSPSPAGLETLGLLEHQLGRAQSFEHLESAALGGNNAEYWLALSSECPDASCTFRTLNAALQIAPHDPRALSRLADYYLARNQLTKARDLLRQAAQFAPSDFVIRARLADVYTAAGLTTLAVQESGTLQNQFPAPFWLQRKVAARFSDVGLLKQALSTLAPSLKNNFDDPETRALLARIYERMGDASALEQLTRDSIRLDPYDTSSLATLARIELGKGDVQSARQSIEAALAIAPTNPGLRQSYADILSRAGETNLAGQQLAQLLRVNPRLDSVRQHLRLLSKDQKDQSDAPDQSYLEDATSLATESHCTSSPSDTNAVALADIRVERMFETGLSSVRVQQLFCITTTQGARDYANRTVQYSPSTQDLRVLHARIYKPDGRVFDAGETGESAVSDASVSMYYDVRSRVIRFPGLEKGDVIELDYRISPTTNINPYGDYFASLTVFRSSIPQLLKRYVLIAPADRRLSIDEQRISSASRHLTQHPDGAPSEQVYRWELRNVAPLSNEPRGPSLTETSPHVHVSTFSSWAEIGQWYAQLIRPQFELDSALRDIAAQIAPATMTELDRINAIHRFVLRNTHYVAFEFGVYSYKPYPVSQTYARRFGDCKDKASLMIALLRQAGIDADLALVRTRRLGDVDERATSMALFNHAIVYIPKFDLWLDGTAEYAGPKELPLDDQGAMALVVSLDGSSTLRRIPVTRPEDNLSRRVVQAQLLPNGAIRFTGTAYTRGEEAPGLRRDLEIPERQRDSFRSSLTDVFPTVHIDDVHVEGATDLARDVNVEFRGTLDTFTGHSVVSLGTSWMQRSYVQTLAPQASRQTDLLLPAPWTTEEELHFQLPAGATITALPGSTSLATPFGSAQIRYDRHGRDLVVTTSVQFRQIRITPEQYAAFRDFCRDVERAFQQEVKVQLRG